MGLFDFGFNFSKSSGGGTDIPGSKELMQFQSDQWRGNTQWFNENGYKFLRQGLINADYNPILAIGASPLDGQMPNASAVQGTTAKSGGFNMSPSANMQAQTARKLSDSQITLNKATASKAVEEALTEQNKRLAYDADTSLKNAQSSEIWNLMPYKIKKTLAEMAGIRSTIALNSANASAIKQDADTRKMQYELNKNTTIQEQKYREEHPVYNWVDRWSKALSPWAMPVVIGTSAKSQPNYEKIYTENANFDRNGSYKGHTRTTTTRTKGRI